MGFFPVDDETLTYLRRTARTVQADRTERYCKENLLFHSAGSPEPVFSSTLGLDLSTLTSSLAGPRRPQDLVPLKEMRRNFVTSLPSLLPSTAPQARHELAQANYGRWVNEGGSTGAAVAESTSHEVGCSLNGEDFSLRDGSVVIAAITSCTTRPILRSCWARDCSRRRRSSAASQPSVGQVEPRTRVACRH